jgi:hypothetical protein
MLINFKLSSCSSRRVASFTGASMRLVWNAAFAVVAGMLACGPTDAAIIMQSGNNYSYPFGGADYFDPALGTLDRVTLTLSSTESRMLLVRADAPGPVTFSWSVDGLVRFEPLTGSGSATVDPGGALIINLAGSATMDIDPAGYVHSGHGPFWPVVPDIQITSTDPGMFTASDLTITSDQASDVFQYRGCWVGPSAPSEWCQHTSFSLIYDYTPYEAPEPSTWAMMLVGFGTLGWLLRRQTNSNSTALKI